VHKKPPHQIKQVFKDPMQLVKLRYGRVDKVTYWVNHSYFKECFLGGPPSNPCGEDKLDGVNTFGHGYHDI
jgi:hypothetical protein